MGTRHFQDGCTGCTVGCTVFKFYQKLQAFLNSILFFRTAQYNDENLARNQVKTIFLSGSSERMVLRCIRRTMDYPDLTYTQGDRARVCVKRYRFPVGEMVWFDEDRRLVTRLLNRVKVVYTRDREGDIRIITAFPLLWHQVRTIFS